MFVMEYAISSYEYLNQCLLICDFPFQNSCLHCDENPLCFWLNSLNIIERDDLVFTILEVVVKLLFNLSRLGNSDKILAPLQGIKVLFDHVNTFSNSVCFGFEVLGENSTQIGVGDSYVRKKSLIGLKFCTLVRNTIYVRLIG